MAKTEILVADDDPVIRNLLTEQLEVAGFKVIAAVDGTAALRLLGLNPHIRLVLLDWVMPGLSGIECLKKIHGHSQFKKIPVVMISALQDKERILEAGQAGAKNYLIKPFDNQKLLETIRKALQEYGK